MNRYFAVAVLVLCGAVTAHAQQDTLEVVAPVTLIDYEDKIFESQGLQVKPEYPGGISAFYKFVGANMKLPDLEPENDLSLKIFLSFVIEKDGTLGDIKVLRDPGYGLGEAAKKVLSLSKKWSPGKQNGTVVRSSFMVPISVNFEGVGKKEEAPIKE